MDENTKKHIIDIISTHSVKAIENRDLLVSLGVPEDIANNILPPMERSLKIAKWFRKNL